MNFFFKSRLAMAVALISTTLSFTVNADSVPFKNVTYTWSEGAFSGGQYQIQLNENSLHWEALAGPEEGKSATENTVSYIKLSENIQIITWLEGIGYTVTVILNTETRHIDGIVSNNKEHYILSGTMDKLVK